MVSAESRFIALRAARRFHTGTFGMSSDPQKLLDFIRAAKKQSVGDDFIVAMLRQNGWPERRIFQAFATYYESALGTPVPSRGSRLENARDAFYYLLIFISLGFWTVALVLFADAYVDHAIPSALDYSYNGESFRTQVAGQLATLILAFPLFLFVSRLTALELARRPEAFESGVRKWLTYVALVVTAVTLLLDAVWFLSSYLSGDLTARFAWKAALLFIVASGVFSYYLGIARADAPARRRDIAFGAGAAALVAVALLLGFSSIGSPMSERAYAADQLRISRLSFIASTIHDRWQDAQKAGTPVLPQSLKDVRFLDPEETIDPISSTPFSYWPLAGPSYRLCATFEVVDYATPLQTEWHHPAGLHCFTMNARENTAIVSPH
jgi:hypothetical protein